MLKQVINFTFGILGICLGYCQGNKLCSSDVVSLKTNQSYETLTSPNYPEFYPGDEFCRWIISVNESYQVVRIRVVESRLTSSEKCAEDYLILQDGSGIYAFSMRNCCGSSCEGDVLTSTGSSMSVTFRSVAGSSDEGFKLEYWAVHRAAKEVQTPVWGAVNYFLFTLFAVIASTIAMGMVIVGFGRRENRETKPKFKCDSKSLRPIAGLILCSILCAIILPIFIGSVYLSI